MSASRKDRLIREKIHDPYHETRKSADGVMCPACHAIYQSGHWLWPREDEIQNLSSADQSLCPACRRIRDKYPAGIVVLEGQYLNRRKEEILNLVDRIVKEQSYKSPLKKVISHDENKGAIVIHVTDDHLARQLGEAIHRAHKGDLKIKYGEEARFVRVHWRRDIT